MSISLNSINTRVTALESKSGGFVLIKDYGTNGISTNPNLDLTTYINQGYRWFGVNALLRHTSTYNRWLYLLNSSTASASIGRFSHHYEYANVAGGAQIQISSNKLVASVSGSGSNNYLIYSVFAIKL